MKRFFLSLSFFLSVCLAGTRAQVYFQEDFGRVPVEQQAGSVPEGWVLYDDGNLPDFQFGYCTQAWNVWLLEGNKVALSPSWFTNPGIRADRWMITPEIALPEASDAVFDFRARSFDQGERETYLVLASTSTAEKEDFTDTLFHIKSENGNWTARMVSLRRYAGKRIRLAFVQRSLDRYALYVDDIRVSDLGRPQVRLSGLSCPARVSPDSTFSFSVQAQMLSDEPIMGYRMGYSLQAAGKDPVQGKSEQPVEETGSGEGLRLCLFEMAEDRLSLSELGTYVLRVWADSVNGKAVVSDTLEKRLDVSSIPLFERNTLLEVFSSSTCGGCPYANRFIKKASDAVYASGQALKLSMIKYQMDFPGPNDPCVVADGLQRGDYYGVTSVPSVFLNGVSFKTSWENFPDRLPLLIDQESVRKTPFGIEAEMIRVGNSFRVEVEVSHATAYDGAVLYVVFTEDSLHHEPQGNGETDFFHVARKILPQVEGEELALESSGKEHFTFSYAFDGTDPEIFSSLDGLSAVVLIQDSKSREVLQSVTLPAIGIAGNEREGKSAAAEVEVCPNPCRDHCLLAVSLFRPSRVGVEICDLQGKRIWKMLRQYWPAGCHSVDIPVEDWKRGVYLVRIGVGETFITEKIVIC